MATESFTVDDGPWRCRLGRILIGEPHADTRQLYRECLKELGLEIIEASTGAEALSMALLHKPTLLITELFMPRVDGFTLCQRWREAWMRPVRIPVVTTESRPFQLARALAAGADMVLRTPVQLDDFVRRCVDLLTGTPTTTAAEESQALWAALGGGNRCREAAASRSSV